MLKLGKLNKLLKMWGIDEPALTVEGALEKLCDYPPFGVKTETVEIMPEQSITGFIDDDAGNATPIYQADTSVSVDIKPDKVYDVYFNDKKYTCTGFVMEEVVVLGNANVMGATGMADNGEPFCIVNAPSIEDGETTLACVWNTTEGETITLAIYEEQEVVQQLAPKFLPEALQFGEETKTVRTEIYNVIKTSTNGGSIYFADRQLLNGFETGTLFKLVINGEEYITDDHSISASGYTSIDFGKYSFGGMVVDDGVYLSGLEPNTEYTIKLDCMKPTKVVTPIDIKYLPIDELKTALGLE